MNFGQMQTECLAYGFGDSAYRSRFKAWLNDAQRLTLRRVPIRETWSRSTVTTTSGTKTYTLPTDLVGIRSLTDSASNVPLDPIDPRWLDTITASSGTPRTYALDDTGLVLYPTPDGAYSLLLRYVANPADMAADTDTPLIPAAHHDLLISYAVSRAYRSEDDDQRAQTLMSDYERGVAQLADDRLSEVQDGPKQVPGMWTQRHPITPGYR